MVTATELEKALSSALKGSDKPSRRELRESIEKHAAWLDASDETGIRADFSGKNLEGADLVDARLPESILNKTNLKSADLTLADLREASLVQANLAEANLLGTQFQQTSLQAADLHGATGLLSAQLAGANLFGATLPESVSPYAGVKLVRQVADKAGWLLALTEQLQSKRKNDGE